MNFPKAEPAETECSLRLKVGNAVVMYNMLRDGNLEENAIYNIPATKGEVLLMAMRIWNKTLL